ncbi:MAG: MFS transporter, partial [Promethearchaeota archaeon]
MNEIIKNAQSPKTRHSKWIFLSNACFQIPSTMVNAVLGGFLLFYYEVIIGLNVWLIVLALTIFTVYNAINDPIIGFLVDRNTRFTRKWGRRFPWIIVGIIPWMLSVYFVFSVPDIDPSTNPWPIFGWL